MGSQGAGQAPLFYAFNLEDHVPGDHLLRGTDRFMDLSELRHHLVRFYSHAGRPSIDPALMIRMLVIGYSLGVRSEWRLCEKVHLYLGYRWFCRLGLEDRIPEHSTFSKNRHGRFRQSDAFRHVFESVVRRCMGEGLVGSEGFAIDAIARKLNERPRKTLGYRTPAEIPTTVLRRPVESVESRHKDRRMRRQKDHVRKLPSQQRFSVQAIPSDP